jgi:DNA-binding IclR family transcriptional regulator
VAENRNRDDTGYQVPAIGKAVAILEALRRHGELTISEVVEFTKINKSTAYYLMQTLVEHRLIEEDNRRYRLGLGLLHLASGVAEVRSEIDIIKRHLADLQPSFDATFVIYRRLDADHVILVDSVRRDHGIHITVVPGSVIPIQGGSFGRCFLAYDSTAQIDRILRKGLTRYTRHSVTDPDIFRTEIARARKLGWAVDREGFAVGVTTVAAPIVSSSSAVEFAVGAVAFASSMTAARIRAYGGQLAAACEELATLLAGAAAAQAAHGVVVTGNAAAPVMG